MAGVMMRLMKPVLDLYRRVRHEQQLNAVGHLAPTVTIPPNKQIQQQELTMNRIRFLKVKLKSLAEEARIIRLEEQRSQGALRESLHEHRVHVVRCEARATHVAYAYLRGRSREAVEPKARTEPDWIKVERMVAKYHVSEKQHLDFWAWKQGKISADLEGQEISTSAA